MDAKKRSAVLPSAATIYLIFSLLGCSSSDSPTTSPQTNLPPQITIAGEFNHPEGQLYVTELNANDSDGDNLSFELSGDDAEQFTLTSNSLYFVDAPDYSAPADTDQNNSYSLSLTVSDGQQSATAQFQINVLEQLKRTELSIGFKPPRLVEFNWQENGAASHYQIMLSTDGGNTYTQVGEDIAAGNSQSQHEINLTQMRDANYRLYTCDQLECLSSEPVWVGSELNQAIGILRANTPKSNIRFGYRISVSGDGKTIAVGSYDNSNSAGVNGDDTDASGSEVGSVQIFNKQGTDWILGDYIKPLNPNTADWFAEVSLNYDGTVLAVGAPGEDGTGDGVNPVADDDISAVGTGAVYIFRLVEGTWEQTDYIKASNPDPHDSFGFSVDLDAEGNTLAVGAIGEDNVYINNIIEGQNNNELESGAVYVFEFVDEVWRQRAYIKPAYPLITIDPILAHEESEFGHSVSLSDLGDRLAVGAPHEKSLAGGVDAFDYNNEGESAGAAFLYWLDDEQNWQFDAYLKPNVINSSDRFGFSLDFSGDGTQLLVGAPGEQSDRLGISEEIGFYNNRLSGAAYWFHHDESGWRQTNYLKAPNNRAQSQFGHSVSISETGATAVIAAHMQNGVSLGLDNNLFIYDQDNSLGQNGAVYQVKQHFDDNNLPTGELFYSNYIKAPHLNSSGFFGWSVAMDAKGDLLAVGTPRETKPSDVEPNPNPLAAGAVFIY